MEMLEKQQFEEGNIIKAAKKEMKLGYDLTTLKVS